MRFGNMREKIVLLAPDYGFENSVGETVPAWAPFSPYRSLCNPDDKPVLHVIEGDYKLRFEDGKGEADLVPYRIWASVIPMTGREYEEAQKLRAELTYKIKIRYADGIQSDFKVLYRGRILNVESAIEVNAARCEIQLICSEVDTYGKAD